MTIDPALLAAMTGAGVMPVMLVEVDTADGIVFAWSGLGNLNWNGNTFTGVGDLGGVAKTEETTDGSATGFVLSLSGIPDELVSISLNSIRQGKRANVWLGALDKEMRLIGEPELIAAGETDVPTLADDGATAAISISCETRAIDQGRNRVRRYTSADQQIYDPTDRGFEYVPTLQDAQIIWGSAGLSI